ncbi:MAG: AzlC family ABC transporter permease [Oceanospirillaceae bacterium]|jgi:4-azaleucine resistance transporter AzlC|nr:AzlC family ABC transporter permease [Oceanospirillaceae bacterium]MBT4441720.1 AzlC family ABC transporter permease [Oceanospirillaceae bacterium]MBT6076803.1 AzlC family ABC transporter permease [Oceanospirillaceae bacterium]MBT7331230.1 AzlC family ABC transporter permease [Oceanospirillaceae bacterium]
MSLSKSTEFINGAKATIPLIIGAIPFGIIFGTLAEPSGLSIWGAMAMSLFVFAGSSQFIAVGLLAAGVGPALIVATTFVVNLRHLLYATALVDKVSHLSQAWRAVLAFGLTDESFAAVNSRYLGRSDTTHAHWFFLGSIMAMYSNWQLCTWLGIGLGELFPDMTQWGLDFAMSVTFLGMVIPYLRNKPMWLAVISAAAFALVLRDLPHQLGLVIAALSGICIGYASQQIDIRIRVAKATAAATEERKR